MKIKIACVTEGCRGAGRAKDHYMVLSRSGVYSTTSSVCQHCRRQMPSVAKTKAT